MANELLGDSFKLYYDTADNFDTPTWVEQKSVGDLGRDFAPERVQVPKRVAFKVYKGGRSDLTFTFTMNWDLSNTFHQAVLAAIEDGSMVHLAIANGDITTATNVYWHGMFHLVGPEDFSLDAAAGVEVEAKPHADSDDLPEKVTVSA